MMIYVGSDAAGKQLSAIFTGSEKVRKMIDANTVNVREVIDRMTTAIK